MPAFPHLGLVKKVSGIHKPKQGGPRRVDPTTQGNLDNRRNHGQALISNVESLSRYWKTSVGTRSERDLPPLPDPNIAPIFLKIDTQQVDIETLKNSFGIEVVAEEEGGFIIGASSEDFTSLRDKIRKFIEEDGRYKNKAAQLWDIDSGIQWRVDQILSGDLRNRWDTISDTEELIVDVGIACNLKRSNQPKKNKDETEAHFQIRLANWKVKKVQAEEKREEHAMHRQTQFETLVNAHAGEFLKGYADYDDSFSCRIKISGKGLKDIVLNYQYAFEVVAYDPLDLEEPPTEGAMEIDPNLIPPQEHFPKICVIDSGIQEGHRLLSPAIDSTRSRSFVDGDTNTADVAGNGGHGTKVAGAILFPNSIPRTGDYQLPCFIQNARVLEHNGSSSTLPRNLFPPNTDERYS